MRDEAEVATRGHELEFQAAMALYAPQGPGGNKWVILGVNYQAWESNFRDTRPRAVAFVIILGILETMARGGVTVVKIVEGTHAPPINLPEIGEAAMQPLDLLAQGPNEIAIIQPKLRLSDAITTLP